MRSIAGDEPGSQRYFDMVERIKLENVSIRFRMSYHKIASTKQMVSEAYRRFTQRWTPDYFDALDSVSLTVNTGEIVGVIGRNGSGKSTLLRTISGIYQPDKGKISVSGKISALLQLGTGFNTQLSGRENIILGGLTLGLDRQDIEARIENIIEFSELGDFIDVPMQYYSSGMMSRLSFSIVVSLEPDILLIDETLSVGDLEFQNKSQTAMHRMIEQATCQMIVSHSLDTIQDLCTRVILIDHGKLLFDGEPKHVIKEYIKLTQ